jgi:heme-degrading monooxygenase HmoA
MQHKGDLPGFIEGEIFQSEDRSRLLIITEWTSLHDWSMSQWDRDVSDNLVSIVETAVAIDSRTYYRVGRISKDGFKG